MSATSVRRDSGTEGPRYDPYHWEEITVQRRGREVVLRLGLDCWLEVDGWRVVEHDVDECDRWFEEFAGMTSGQAIHWYERARETCPDCGHRGTVVLGGGYAAETVYGCPNCGRPMYDDFRMSMIE